MVLQQVKLFYYKMISCISGIRTCCVHHTLPRPLSLGIPHRACNLRNVKAYDGSQDRNSTDINGDEEIKDFWEVR